MPRGSWRLGTDGLKEKRERDNHSRVEVPHLTKGSEGEVLGKCGVVPEVVAGTITTHQEEVMVHMGGIPLLVVTAVNLAEDMVDTIRMVTMATTVTTVAHMDSTGDKEDGGEDVAAVVGVVDVGNRADSVQVSLSSARQLFC